MISSTSQIIYNPINISFVVGEERVVEVSVPSVEKYLFSSFQYLRICLSSPTIPYKCNNFRLFILVWFVRYYCLLLITCVEQPLLDVVYCVRKSIISEKAAIVSFLVEMLESFYRDNLSAHHEVKHISRAVLLYSLSSNLKSGHYKH